MFSFLRNIFQKNSHIEPLAVLKNIEEFHRDYETLTEYVSDVNSIIYTTESKKPCVMLEPEIDMMGLDEKRYTEGYVIDLPNYTLTMYPEEYRDGKFSVEVNKLKHEKDKDPLIVKTTIKRMDLEQLCNFITTDCYKALPHYPKPSDDPDFHL